MRGFLIVFLLACSTLSLGAKGAWLVEVEGPWFIGNEAALRPMCDTWKFPFRTLDKAIDMRTVADAVGFWKEGRGAAAPTSKPLAALEKELGEIVERAGGRIAFSERGGGIAWWREAGNDRSHAFLEVGEIRALDHLPPLGVVTFECGYWDRVVGAWKPAVCGKGRNDTQGAMNHLKVLPGDCERAFQLFQWILLRRGEYGEPIRMM